MRHPSLLFELSNMVNDCDDKLCVHMHHQYLRTPCTVTAPCQAHSTPHLHGPHGCSSLADLAASCRQAASAAVADHRPVSASAGWCLP